ncbi:hypothetical protein Bca52824_010438 [Brassica carinata]|uniref:F-box associated beta-propeller type 3 domain-containing protein n=1 Tax=Brassica carinata TaxID=52824 RepID=A0A8X7WEH2_BRACI|nr:hypothetical protein Bca52824_010438 [Brassica carinata]
MKSKRTKRAKTLSNGREKSVPIPTDLIIDIFLRPPLKSVARFRCVSMLWASIVALPYLTKLFTNRDSAHPQLLFVYRQLDKLVFLSSPQPQNLDENSSYVAVKHLPRIPFHCSSCYVSGLVQGLLSLRVISKRMQPVHIICNPSTGQALTLPKIKRMRGRLIRARNLLGYDPIDNQSRYFLDQPQVLTLGTGELKWRRIKCSPPQNYFQPGKCINGVLYYPVRTPKRDMIGCFHVRSETFSFIEVEGTLKGEVFSCTLINYNGKLGSLITRYCFVDRACRSIKLLVIGNFEKQESSKHEYVLPPMWEDVVGRAELRLVGLVGTNEVVLSDPSQVIYYNIETRGVAKVAIQGIEASPECEFATFLHHIEDLKLAQAFK